MSHNFLKALIKVTPTRRRCYANHRLQKYSLASSKMVRKKICCRSFVIDFSAGNC